MYRWPGLAALFASTVLAQSPVTTGFPFTSHDGHPMFGKLTLPASKGLHPVLIYVQTAEGATVDMKRPLGGGRTFNYYDLYREKLPPINWGFFSYEGRGVRMGDSPPRYEQIDREIYNTSTLDNKVRDILSAVDLVREQPGVDPNRIFLIGASEGTLLSAEAASRAPGKIHGLILYGVLSSTLQDALRYMAADGAFLQIRALFDADRDGSVSPQEYANEGARRRGGLTTTAFEVLDADADGSFSVTDFRKLRKVLLDAIDARQVAPIAAWLGVAAAVSIPDNWIQDHFAHGSMWSFLSKLDIPAGLFQGSADGNTPIDGTRALEATAKAAGKTNLQFHYFDGLDHSLSIAAYFVNGSLPAGHQAIFEFLEAHTK